MTHRSHAAAAYPFQLVDFYGWEDNVTDVVEEVIGELGASMWSAHKDDTLGVGSNVPDGGPCHH